MKKEFNFSLFNSEIGYADGITESKVRIGADADLPSRFLMQCKDFFKGDYNYLVCDVEGEEDWAQVFMFEFWNDLHNLKMDEPDLTIRMSVLPKFKTRLCLPLRALNAQNIFLPRTRGQLRSFVTGNAISPEKIIWFAFGLREGPEKQKMNLYNAYLTNELPDFPLPDIKLVDEMGQNKTMDWPGKTSGSTELNDYLKNEYEKSKNLSWLEGLSQYGGLKSMSFEKSGYFRVIQHEGVWWLVDPDGYLFFGAGLDCVRPGEEGPVNSISPLYDWLPPKEGEYSDAWHYLERWASWPGFIKEDVWQFSFAEANLIRAFGKDWHNSWMEITKSRMKSWGFNSVGVASDKKFIKEAKIPYVSTLTGYPTTAKRIYRDFPDVYSDEFKKSAKEYAAQLSAFEGDRYLIGYFMRNEPQWAFAHDLEIAEELLAVEGEFESKNRFIEILKAKYISIEEFNIAWKLKLNSFDDLKKPIPKAASLSPSAKKDIDYFSYQLIREYVKVPAEACRKVDAHHLNLGMRYAFILYPNQAAGKEFMDVFSINSYKIDPTPVLKHIAGIVKMPIMIGEFHFGALDRGVRATGIIGVKNQAERGKAYQYYFEKAAAIPECIAMQYFILNDQMTLGRPDGENYQIGFVDCCHRPYDEMTGNAVEAHKRMYDVHSGKIAPTDTVPIKITPNMASLRSFSQWRK